MHDGGVCLLYPFLAMYNDSSDSIGLRTEAPLRPWFKEPKNIFIMLLMGALTVICLINYLPKSATPAPAPAPVPSMRAIVVLGGSAGVSGQLVLKQPSGQNVQVRAPRVGLVMRSAWSSCGLI